MYMGGGGRWVSRCLHKVTYVNVSIYTKKMIHILHGQTTLLLQRKRYIHVPWGGGQVGELGAVRAPLPH
jgi:hypothetical protein